MIASPDDVLELWFGPKGSPPMESSARWFRKDPDFDRDVHARFGETLAAAKRGECDGWRATPRGRVAMVILFDQLSRNMFRDTAASFAQDDAALALTLDTLEQKLDADLAPLERYFLLMPLMHAESREVQSRSLVEFERLRTEAAPGFEKMLESAVDYAKKHAAIVEKFGRYPHRNAIVGRETTPEEATFLAGPGSSF